MSIVDIARGIVSAIWVAGPIFVLLGVAVCGVELLRKAGRARLTLAFRGLAGARRSWPQRLAADVLVPALGITAITVCLSLEQEIREGPNRMLTQLEATLPSPAYWVLQAGSGHLLDVSSLPPAVTAAAARSNADVPLWMQQTQLASPGHGSQTGLVIGLPSQALVSFGPEVDISDAACARIWTRCQLRAGQFVTDANSYPIGAPLTVLGKRGTVVAHTSGDYSMLNRTVAFTSAETFAGADGSMPPAFAIIVAGANAQSRAQALAGAAPDGTAEVLSSDQIAANNATFWAGNGTTLTMLLILVTVMFCGVALYAGRRSIQERERVAVGVLRSFGLTPGEASAIDLMRTFRACLLGAVIAWPVSWALIAVTDATLTGFHASVSPLMVIAATGLVIAAETLATAMLVVRLREHDVSEAIAA